MSILDQDIESLKAPEMPHCKTKEDIDLNMDLNDMIRNVFQALYDGRNINLPNYGMVAMDEDGNIGYMVKKNGEDMVLLSAISEIPLNGFIRAVCCIPDDQMIEIVANNALKRIQKDKRKRR